MALEIDGKYQVVYRDGRDEKTVIGRYRGLRTADFMGRGGKSRVSTEDVEKYHWFQVDRTHGFVSVHPDDLVSYEVAD